MKLSIHDFSASDWRYAADQFVKKLPDKVIVHRECSCYLSSPLNMFIDDFLYLISVGMSKFKLEYVYENPQNEHEYKSV